jgi:DeoR/GlpR family transcriptional regulator of sugar metabolism
VLAAQRQKLILDQIRHLQAVRVRDLTDQLGVSEMTVRRDLDVLAADGHVLKVHGGATLRRGSSSDEPGFTTKSTQQLAEKEAIAQAAAELIRAGDAIAIGAGTTTWRLAHYVSDIPNLTIVTNSIQVASALRNETRPDTTVAVTGGVRTPSDALVGPLAVATIGSLHVDLLFLGVHGLTEDAGFTTPNLLEAETNRALIDSAERLVVVADHTKWGVRGLSRIARLDEAHVLISDRGLSADARAVLGEHVGQLVLAAVGGR